MSRRRRFNPADVAGPLPLAPKPGEDVANPVIPTGPTVLTVSQVSQLITRTLEDRLPPALTVVGEVSNFSRRNHWYFSLKDETAVLSCVAWASAARRFGFTPRDGQQVIASGHVSHYGAQGRTQFYVSHLLAVGEGVLEQRYRALCQELRGLGYFDEARKRPLPFFPRRIAVMTSPAGAALQDVIATARQRCAAVALLIVGVRVQGEGAAQEVANAVRMVNRRRKELGVEAILVTRGGGSIEDLWAFNERVVADAVFASDLPVVAAIGHESDVTIIELVADQRCATPTQAAMRLVPSAFDLRTQVEHHAARLHSLVSRGVRRERELLTAIARRLRHPREAMHSARDNHRRRASALNRAWRSRLDRAHVRVERLASHLESFNPDRQTSARRERLLGLAERLRLVTSARIRRQEVVRQLSRRLDESWNRSLRGRRNVIERREDRLRAVNVASVLNRGFTYTLGHDGTLIRSIHDARPGGGLNTHVPDGVIRSIVEGGAARRAPKSGMRDDERQLDLFRPAE